MNLTTFVGMSNGFSTSVPVTEELYLLPSFLGYEDPNVLSVSVIQKIKELTHFIVENEKTARAFLKVVEHSNYPDGFEFYRLDKRTSQSEVERFFTGSKKVGLLSEAGLPCIADPGRIAVSYAHEQGIRVVPMPGPSSILMALIASGFNGQEFTFHGYLPHDRKDRHNLLRTMERDAQQDKTQLFMETPYRNDKLFSEVVKVLKPETKLSIASGITFPEAFIETHPVQDWRVLRPQLNRIPSIFGIGSNQRLRKK